MTKSLFPEILAGLHENRIVPYLGPGVLFDAKNKVTGEPMPADSESLILAMNGGKPMAPKLMYEFPRAAMNQELKRGRTFVNRFLTQLYGQTEWTRAALHDWLKSWKPAYVVDINRDIQLQASYADRPHILVTGLARITAGDYRFKIFLFEQGGYREVGQQDVDASLPILFKPMGTPWPEANFVASDADYVDYITELMGGFAIPDFLKSYRKGKQYLLIGLPLCRDSERMVMSDIVYSAAEPKGWVLNPAPTAKEKRFCDRMGFELIDADVEDLLRAAGFFSQSRKSA